MSSEAECKLDLLLTKARTRPFATMPLDVEAVLWEEHVSLGTVAAWKVGDSLEFNSAELPDVELRIGGHPVGSGRVIEGNSIAVVQFSRWLETT